MKKVLFTAFLFSVVLLGSCGTSANYYASSDFEDGIYYRPSAESRQAAIEAEKEVDRLVAKTKQEAARFTDTIVVSGPTSSVNLDYRPDTRYAIVLDNDSSGYVEQVDITFNFDDWYWYRGYNYWDYWYMAHNWPWCGYWGYYSPWFSPGWGIGFGWDPWWGWSYWGGYYAWYDPWYGPWYGPWYHYGYYPWAYHDFYAAGFYHGYLAESHYRREAHNVATATRVADIRAGGGGRSSHAVNTGRVQVGSDIRGGRDVNLGEKYVDRGGSVGRGDASSGTTSRGTFRRAQNVNTGVSRDDVRNNYYNGNNSFPTRSTTAVNSDNYNRNTYNTGRTTSSYRNTSSYGNARSSSSGTFRSSGTSVRSGGGGGGGTRSGGGRR